MSVSWTLGEGPEEREHVIKTLKTVYALRSKRAHGGVSGSSNMGRVETRVLVGETRSAAGWVRSGPLGAVTARDQRFERTGRRGRAPVSTQGQMRAAARLPLR